MLDGLTAAQKLQMLPLVMPLFAERADGFQVLSLAGFPNNGKHLPTRPCGILERFCISFLFCGPGERQGGEVDKSSFKVAIGWSDVGEQISENRVVRSRP